MLSGYTSLAAAGLTPVAALMAKVGGDDVSAAAAAIHRRHGYNAHFAREHLGDIAAGGATRACVAEGGRDAREEIKKERPLPHWALC